MVSRRTVQPIEPDQSDFNLGIRDVARADDSEAEAKFVEVEQEAYLFRRDPEESKHNEAGTHVVTQGDIEFEKMSKENKE